MVYHKFSKPIKTIMGLERAIKSNGLGREAVRSTIYYYTQMMRSTMLNDRIGVQRLLVDGFPINEFDDTGRTFLHIAAYHGREKVVDAMVQYGADINAVSGDGETPIQTALRAKQNTTWRMMNVAYARYGAKSHRPRDVMTHNLMSDDRGGAQ